jgi:hypothetical protein
VNIAARMEASGAATRINMSAAVYERTRAFFDFEPRGSLDAKNKGRLDMFFLLGLKPEFARDEARCLPNTSFAAHYDKLSSGYRFARSSAAAGLNVEFLVMLPAGGPSDPFDDAQFRTLVPDPNFTNPKSHVAFSSDVARPASLSLTAPPAAPAFPVVAIVKQGTTWGNIDRLQHLFAQPHQRGPRRLTPATYAPAPADGPRVHSTGPHCRRVSRGQDSA